MGIGMKKVDLLKSGEVNGELIVTSIAVPATVMELPNRTISKPPNVMVRRYRGTQNRYKDVCLHVVRKNQ